MDNFTAWLDDGEAAQAKRAAHEDPAFKSEEVSSWLMRLQKVRRCGLVARCCGGGWTLVLRLCQLAGWLEPSCTLCLSELTTLPLKPSHLHPQEFTRLNSKKKPRPPPPPPPPADANATDAEGAKAEGEGQADGEQQAEGEHAEQQGQGEEKQQEKQQEQEEQPAGAEEEEDKLDHDELRR